MEIALELIADIFIDIGLAIFLLKRVSAYSAPV